MFLRPVYINPFERASSPRLGLSFVGAPIGEQGPFGYELNAANAPIDYFNRISDCRSRDKTFLCPFRRKVRDRRRRQFLSVFSVAPRNRTKKCFPRSSSSYDTFIIIFFRLGRFILFFLSNFLLFTALPPLAACAFLRVVGRALFRLCSHRKIPRR